jgi:hypothetical protein
VGDVVVVVFVVEVVGGGVVVEVLVGDAIICGETMI